MTINVRTAGYGRLAGKAQQLIPSIVTTEMKQLAYNPLQGVTV